MCLHCSFRSEYGGAQSCEKRHSHTQLQLLIKDGPERATPPAFDGARAGRAGERTPLAVNHVRCLNRTGVVACALVCSRWVSAVWQSQRRVAARRRPVRRRPTPGPAAVAQAVVAAPMVVGAEASTLARGVAATAARPRTSATAWARIRMPAPSRSLRRPRHAGWPPLLTRRATSDRKSVV